MIKNIMNILKSLIITTKMNVVFNLLFFIISNFYVWSEGLMYEPNLTGLIKCYVAGIPFIFSVFYKTLIPSLYIVYAIELFEFIVKIIKNKFAI